MKKFCLVEFCAVGLKDGGVKDQDITASSVHGTAYEARFARLDRIGTRIHYGGWLSYGKSYKAIAYCCKRWHAHFNKLKLCKIYYENYI